MYFLNCFIVRIVTYNTNKIRMINNSFNCLSYYVMIKCILFIGILKYKKKKYCVVQRFIKYQWI